jgi:predicted AAA+ superfamily ATPase
MDIFPYYCCLFVACIPVVKAPLNSDGLQLVEVEKYYLIDLHDIVEKIYHIRDALFCIAAMIYATPSHRHMMPEFMQNNRDTQHLGEKSAKNCNL